MKKRFLMLFLMLISIIGFNIIVDASAPRTLKTGNTIGIPDYVSGYPIYWKSTDNQRNELFCEVANLRFPEEKTITRISEVEKGLAYIIKNKPKTWSGKRDYYVTQMAVWWYKDILNGGNSNLDSNFKNYCQRNKNSHDICSKIIDLVEGAKNYSKSKASMVFDYTSVNFTQSGNYYISNVIKVNHSNLNNSKNFKLTGNVPSGASIVNLKNNKDYSQFQIKLNKNYISEGKTYNFQVEANGTYSELSAYDYYYASGYQKVIYDEVYEQNKTIKVTKNVSFYIQPKIIIPKPPALPIMPPVKPVPPVHSPVIVNTLTIEKVDQNGRHINNAELTLYYGDCTKRTCESRNIFSRWTTESRIYKIYDLPTGYYTIEETFTPSGYKTAEKGLIHISRNDINYKYKMVNLPEVKVKPVLINKTDITGKNNLAGATLVIKNSYGNVVERFVSTNRPKELMLKEGYYTLEETKAPQGYKVNTSVIYFSVDKKGNVKIRNSAGNYIPVNEIIFTNGVLDVVNVSKLDKNTNNYLPGVVLKVIDEKGSTVTSWTTTNKSHNLVLKPGVYTLEETYTPKGYLKNTESVKFKLLEDGTLMIRNSNGHYMKAAGIIIYNIPEEVYEENIEVPKTSLSSTMTYVMGSITLVAGAWVLYRNEKYSI